MTLVVKIGGALADSAEAIRQIGVFLHRQWTLQEPSGLKPPGSPRPLVVIHGGGESINELCANLHIDIRQVEGRRITDAETLKVLVYAVGGWINKSLVSSFRAQGLPAVGLTGVDGNLTTAIRRPPLAITWSQTTQEKYIDFGLVGEIQSVDPQLIRLLLEHRFLPVLGCLTWSEKEGILNINADTLACRIAQAVSCSELILLMDVEAVLDVRQTPLTTLNENGFQEGKKSGWISGGMIPKLEAGFEALRLGIPSVRLTNPQGLLTGKGTLLST